MVERFKEAEPKAIELRLRQLNFDYFVWRFTSEELLF